MTVSRSHTHSEAHAQPAPPQEIVWARHTWELRDIEINLVAPGGYVLGSASRDSLGQVTAVVLSAYASDSFWEPLMGGIRERMIERIRSTLGQAGADYLFALRGGEIVAVSGVAKEHWTNQNLLTGVCVLREHQRKGLGRHLLGLSLLRLKRMGLTRAQVYTGSGSLADRKIYRLFGSRREEGVPYPCAGQE